MDFNTITVLHKTDPSLVALRKEWIPLAISFLHLAFKRKHEVLVSQDIFREQLDVYIDSINAMQSSDNQYKHNADYYLDRWSREDDLIRVRAREDGYVVQLSPHGERLIGWFEDLQSRGMVGTESRLLNILSMLDELITQSTEDVEARLLQLYERRELIEVEIAHIEETQQVDSLSDLQIRERLEHISNMAGQLLRDFSLVEERFREMARTIQQAQLNPDLRRGEILGTALDADEQLETSDEGQSFRAFYELLTHPDQRDKFDSLVNKVFEMPRLAVSVGENAVLQRLTSHLLDAGERVNQSNQRLAEHLRRVVDTRNVTESRRVQEISRDIMHLVSQLGDDVMPYMVSRRVFYSIEGEPDIELPLERPLFDPPEQIIASERPLMASALIDDDALSTLYDTFFIDETLLHDNIKRLLMSRSEITLPELVQQYPIKQGMAEVVTYLLIAAQEARHGVDQNLREEISISMLEGEERRVIVPHVVFRRAIKQGEINHV
ncbi:MAG: DUF3375 domain-containing protein [Aggregatilineales bacterium]